MYKFNEWLMESERGLAIVEAIERRGWAVDWPWGLGGPPVLVRIRPWLGKRPFKLPTGKPIPVYFLPRRRPEPEIRHWNMELLAIAAILMTAGLLAIGAMVR